MNFPVISVKNKLYSPCHYVSEHTWEIYTFILGMDFFLPDMWKMALPEYLNYFFCKEDK